tara:strand:- start:54 stop:1211 length:1158 start_codon:yes stop_codon:yes gene_type:complete
MERLLIIHNQYSNLGGEDVAVDEEVKHLENFYNVETLKFVNRIERPLIQYLSFITNKNKISIRKLRETLDSFKPDQVYIHNTWFKASIGIFDELSKRGIPIILKLHNFRYFCTNSLLIKNHIYVDNYCKACGLYRSRFMLFNKYFQESYLKSFFVLIYGKKYFKILKNSQIKIIVLTDFHKKFLLELGFKSTNIFVLPNRISISSEEENKNKDNSIIYAGRISREKGVHIIIEEFIGACLKNTTLDIIGEGPSYESLQNYYKNENIVFHGLKPNNEVKEMISKAKAVVTGTLLYEGQPTLLSEASIRGIPSIFPDNGGISEFFPDDYILKYTHSEAGSLLRKFKLLDSNQYDLQTIGKENQLFIESKLNEDVLLKKFKEIINYSQ